MKAWFLTKINNIENNPLELKKVKLRSLNDDEVLIKLKEIGICKIDLDLIEGYALNFGYPSKKPIIPGHEAVGSVEDIGNKVEEFKKGDLVGISMLYSSCGKCKECLSGNENACSELLITGESIDGCYAEYFIGKSNFIFKIPQEISEKAILTVCNLPLVYKSFKLSLRNLEDKIAIYGLNFFSFLIIQICKFFNIDNEMIVLNEKEERKLNNILKEVNIKKISDINKNYYDGLILFKADDNFYKLIKSVKFKGRIINVTLKSLATSPLLEGKEIISPGIPTKSEILEIQRSSFLNKITFNKIFYNFENVIKALSDLKMNNEIAKLILKIK